MTNLYGKVSTAVKWNHLNLKGTKLDLPTASKARPTWITFGILAQHRSLQGHKRTFTQFFGISVNLEVKGKAG